MINSDILNSSTGILNAKVEFYDGSTLVKACTCSDYLQEFNVSRVGDNSKFFGFGVCQKLSVKLIDMWRDLVIVSGNTVEISYIIGNKEIRPYPTFTITEVNVDEDTNDISVTAYDAINKASDHEINEVDLGTAPQNISIEGFVVAIANYLGVPYTIVGLDQSETCFDTVYSNGPNIDGTERIRDILNAIAEVTQTIYYINYENVLVFKRLDMSGDPVFTISRDSYSVLKTSENRRLSSICSATELGDNVESSLDITGTTQYVRDNPFWDMREDLSDLVEKALAAIGGFTIGQIRDCEWFGNILVEIGDKLAFVQEDGSEIISYLLDDSITYDGFIFEETKWEFTENDAETETNPSSLGEVLNQTFARVDKANRSITLLSSRTASNESDIARLDLTTTGITTEVESVKKNSDEAFANTNSELTKLSTRIEQTSKDLTIRIQEVDEKDITEVKTSTGFTFDDQGLTIEKSDSEMTTKVNEDGMIVSRSGSDVLIANNEGVIAEDLHATTWLIIGKYSRFTDYEDNGKRTACFWIGV